jgi:hypothetical protein
MSMHRNQAACLAVLVALVSACGSDQQPLEIRSTQAIGSVGGMILDAATLEPIAGASVTLVAGGTASTGTTDASGTFAFEEISVGEVAATVAATSYLSAVLHGTLPGAAEFPVDNTVLTFGPIALVPATGSMTAMVQFDDGSPAAGLLLTARADRRFYDYSTKGQAAGYEEAQATVVTATTDASGLVTFAGLPDFALIGESAEDLVTVIVPPIVGQAGDPSLYRYPGGSFPFHLLAVGASTPVIVLRQPTPAALEVVASSISALEGAGPGAVPAVIQPSGPIWITFNQPLDAANTRVVVLDEAGASVNTQPTVTVAYATLQLGFAPQLPEDPSEYNLVIHAVAAVGDRLLRADLWAPFFTPPPTTIVKPTLTRETTVTTDVVTVTFHEPVGTGNAARNTLDGANCVLFFSIDLDGSLTTGDAPGETGNPTCVDTLTQLEPDPAGICGLSGYTRKFQFEVPKVMPGGTPVPAGTPFQMVFSRVVDTNHLFERVNGQVVPDFAGSSLNLILP